jgi:hypothetical protein
MRNNALQDLTLIKIIVAHFVGPGSFVRSYDINISPITEVPRISNNIIPLITKKK